MRVILVVNGLTGGGAERQAALLFTELASRGRDVQLISLGPASSADYIDVESPQVHCLRKGGKADLPRLVRSVRHLSAETDLLLCYNWYPALVGSLARGRSRCVVVYGNPPSWDGVINYRRLLARWVHSRCPAIVGVTYGVARMAVEELGSPSRSIWFVNNGVAEVVSAGSSSAEFEYVLAAGRLGFQKDCDTLLKAFAKVAVTHSHRLVIAGDGPERERLELLAADLGIASRVSWLGFVSDVDRWMRDAECLILSSRFEGFGNVIIEAMAHGTPVVATDAPFGPREMLAKGAPLLLSPVGDVQALADNIARVLEDERQRSLMREEGPKSVRAHWTIQRIADQYESLFDSLSTLEKAR